MLNDDDAPIEALRDAVENLHHCKATFLEAVEVKETHGGQVVWEGAVKVFALAGHPQAKRAYAWSYPTTGTKRQFVAVLGLPPVDSAVMAVRASILANEKAKN
jgi:hypothetical protein